MEGRGRRGRLGVVLAFALGGLWGAAAYAILWGYTSIVVTPRYFQSTLGLMTLLPVRIVLWAITQVEDRIVHHPFSFATNHGWIGVVSSCVGALMVGVPALLILVAVRPRPGAAGQADGARRA